MSFIVRSTVVLVSTLLAACGGGGGSEGSSSGGAATTPVTVSTANYSSVGTESMAATLETTQLSSDFNFVAGAQIAAQPHWAAWGLSQWRLLVPQLASQGAVFVGVTRTTSVDCSGGGNITFAFADTNGNSQIDVGEQIVATLNNCVDLGETANGALTLRFNAQPAGDLNASAYTLDMTMSFVNLTVVSSSLNARANGDLRLVSVRTAALTGSDTVTATSFSSDVTVGSDTRTRTLSGFSATAQLVPAEVSFTFGGTVASSALGNRSVSVSTTSAFKQRYADLYPYTGAASATGANGGKVTLTVVDASQVSFAVDANGDNTAEASTTVAWSSIL